MHHDVARQTEEAEVCGDKNLRQANPEVALHVAAEVEDEVADPGEERRELPPEASVRHGKNPRCPQPSAGPAAPAFGRASRAAAREPAP